VLADLGYDEDEIAAMEADGAIAGRATDSQGTFLS
jgi:hypothetical protein